MCVCVCVMQLYKNSKLVELTLNVIYIEEYHHTHCLRRCPPGVMVKAMECRIVVREFVLQSRYYVHFRENILGKGMNPLILPALG